jgi:hypothetical protein
MVYRGTEDQMSVQDFYAGGDVKDSIEIKEESLSRCAAAQGSGPTPPRAMHLNTVGP